MMNMCMTETNSQSSSISSDTSSCQSNSSSSNNSVEEEAWSTTKRKGPLVQQQVCNDVDDDDSSWSTTARLMQSSDHHSQTTTTTPLHKLNVMELCGSLLRWSLVLSLGVLVSIAISVFSVKLPFVLAPWAAEQTYLSAFYHYDPQHSFFDNTAWTYGTDYGLAVVMTSLGLWIAFSGGGVWNSSSSLAASSPTRVLRFVTACMLWSYAISVTAGGIAHQFYFTAEERNTLGFRLLWTMCVGSVTATSGWMGCIGTELMRQLAREDEEGNNPASSSSSSSIITTLPTAKTTWNRHSVIPTIPEAFWIGFGLSTTWICMLGYMSYQRPACDIFVAGTTQFVSSFYMMSVVGWSFRHHPYIRGSYRTASVVSWILNAPLLPLYPLLIQYTDWTLAQVNTFLHCWLLVAWGLQGYTMQHYIHAVHKATSKPIKAIPIMKKAPLMTTTSTSSTLSKKEM